MLVSGGIEEGIDPVAKAIDAVDHALRSARNVDLLVALSVGDERVDELVGIHRINADQPRVVDRPRDGSLMAGHVEPGQFRAGQQKSML